MRTPICRRLLVARLRLTVKSMISPTPSVAVASLIEIVRGGLGGTYATTV